MTFTLNAAPQSVVQPVGALALSPRGRGLLDCSAKRMGEGPKPLTGLRLVGILRYPLPQGERLHIHRSGLTAPLKISDEASGEIQIRATLLHIDKRK